MKKKETLEERVTRIHKQILSEQPTRENLIGINERRPFIKALDAAERIVRGYTAGETKKNAMAALNVLYSLTQER